MEPKNKQLVQPDEEDDMLYDTDNVVSATECTGLIPAHPACEEQEASYTEIYAIPRSQIHPDTKKGQE